MRRDFSDVQVDGRLFRVDPRLRGDRVLVQWDPFQTDAALEEVQLYSLDGAYLGVGKKYEREKGAAQQPTPEPPIEPIPPRYIDALRDEAAQEHALRREMGVDYRSAQQRNVWSFSAFAAKFARLLGRSAGLSALSAVELEALRAFHVRHDRVDEVLLREAFSRSDEKSIPHVLFQLQTLLAERNA